MSERVVGLPTATHTEISTLLNNAIELGGVAAAIALVGFIAYSGIKTMVNGGKKK